MKIMCDLEISEKRKQQDGKIKFMKIRPARYRTARGDHSNAWWRRRRGDAYLTVGEPIKLVFATRHTNSATESISCLLDMGVAPFNFSDALLGTIP